MNWTNLSSGLLGSAFAGLLTFGAAALTLFLTRRADRQRETRRQDERAAERREALITEFGAIFRALESEVRWAPFLGGRTLRHFLEVALKFQTIEGTRSPLVAAWLIGQFDPVSQTFHSWRRVSFIPFVHTRRRKALGELIGEVVGLMTMWSNGVVPDSAFDDPKRTPRQVTDLALMAPSICNSPTASASL